MNARVRLAVYVTLTVFLPLAALALGLLALSDLENRRSLAGLAVLGAATAALVSYISLRLRMGAVTSALGAMTQRAKAIAIGHVGEHEPVPERGALLEVDHLGRAFNEMFTRVRNDATELERSQREFRRAISRLGDVFGSTHDRGTIVAVVVETATVLVGARTAVYWLVEGEELRPGATAGEGRVRGTLAMGEGLAGAVAQDVVARVGEPEERAVAEPHHEHGMAVPVYVGGRLFGVVGAYGRPASAPFSAEDLGTLTSLVRQSGTAIENTFLHEEAQRLSSTDGLTGLVNRRQLDVRCDRELERSLRFGEHFALILVDLDNFKAVNDTHGHQAGDAVLRELAARLTTVTRDVDTVARFGGEEFAVVLPRTDIVGAATLASKLRRAVCAKPFRVSDDLELPITASLGVGAYPESGTTVEQLVRVTDEALYRAKRAGKDRVERAAAAPPVAATRPVRAARRAGRGT